MSRIGKKPVTVPAGVTVTINGPGVSVKGPKGELQRSFSDLVTVTLEDEQVLVTHNDNISVPCSLFFLQNPYH